MNQIVLSKTLASCKNATLAPPNLFLNENSVQPAGDVLQTYFDEKRKYTAPFVVVYFTDGDVTCADVVSSYNAVKECLGQLQIKSVGVAVVGAAGVGEKSKAILKREEAERLAEIEKKMKQQEEEKNHLQEDIDSNVSMSNEDGQADGVKDEPREDENKSEDNPESGSRVRQVDPHAAKFTSETLAPILMKIVQNISRYSAAGTGATHINEGAAMKAVVEALENARQLCQKELEQYQGIHHVGDGFNIQINNGLAAGSNAQVVMLKEMVVKLQNARDAAYQITQETGNKATMEQLVTDAIRAGGIEVQAILQSIPGIAQRIPVNPGLDVSYLNFLQLLGKMLEQNERVEQQVQQHVTKEIAERMTSLTTTISVLLETKIDAALKPFIEKFHLTPAIQLPNSNIDEQSHGLLSRSSSNGMHDAVDAPVAADPYKFP